MQLQCKSPLPRSRSLAHVLADDSAADSGSEAAVRLPGEPISALYSRFERSCYGVISYGCYWYRAHGIGYSRRWKWNAEEPCRKAIQATGLRSLGLSAAGYASLAGVSASSRSARTSRWLSCGKSSGIPSSAAAVRAHSKPCR